MVLLLALAGMVEGIGVAAMLPLLELVTSGGAGGTGDESWLSLAVERGLGWVGLRPTLGVLLGVIVVMMSAKAAFLWFASRQVGYTVAQVTTDLRMMLLRALLGARWEYYTSQPAGGFANAIISEPGRAAYAYREACIMMAGIIQILIYLAVAFLVSWPMALGTMAISIFFAFLLRGFIRVAREAGTEQTELTRSLAARLTDALRGIKPIRAMARDQHLKPLLERETEGLNQALRKEVGAGEGLRLFQEPTLVFLLSVGLFLALTAGGEEFSKVMVLAFVFYRLLGQANGLQGRYQSVTVGESAFWSLMDRARDAEMHREESTGRTPPPPLKEGIRLVDVAFGYADTRVVDGLSLEVPAGSFVALYGPSGAGKTTIADLIVGFHKPHSGRVEVDGVPLAELSLAEWRGGIGYVPQDVFLFHDTIFRNVTLGDETVTREQVERALRAAGAWAFVAARPEGMDTIVGEAGSRFSGGQQQRIAIARALVHRPRLLILDEATAGLDPETEIGILETIQALDEGMTVLAISHQAAVRDVADVAYVIGGGRVLEVDRKAPGRAEGASGVRG